MSNSFGEKLTAFRIEAGMTRAELAERAGFDELTISVRESGEGEPGWSAVRALAKALGINCHEFGGGGPKKQRAGSGRGRT
jgi:transcriptional regulator with XRE-family HTH domain